MLGTLDPSEQKVTVVGAGIAGLLMAYRLDALRYEVTLLEKSHRVGGLIQTTQTPYGISESAAHSLLVTPTVEAFFKKLKVPLLPAKTKVRWIQRGHRLRRYPLTFLESLELISRVSFVRGRSDSTSLSVEAWASRHLGQAGVDHLLGPFVSGVYAVHPSELGLSEAFPLLKEAVPPGESLLFHLLKRKVISFFSQASQPRKKIQAPAFGMESLIEALESHLKKRLGGRFHLGVACHELPSSRNLVLTVPAKEAARLLKTVDPSLSAALEQVRSVPLVSVTLFAQKKDFLKKNLNGIGFLNSLLQKSDLLGVLLNSSAFDHRVKSEDWVSFTAMLGGSRAPQWLEASDSEIEKAIRCELNRLFGFSGSFLSLAIHRWQEAIPVYNQKLSAAWDQARAGWCSERNRGKVLFGNYTGAVSIRQMIERSEQFTPGS